MTEVVVLKGQRHELHECIQCGVVYAIPAVVIDFQRKHGGWHYCSNGHQQGWEARDCPAEADRLRLERDRLKQQIAQKDDEIKAAFVTASAQHERAKAAEKATARLRKRMQHGVCPCCNRTFANVARHMKTKHPEANVVALKSA